jgi:site-specific DNA recombinase
LLDAARASSQLLQSEADHAAMLAALLDRVELREDGMRLWFRVAIPITGGSNTGTASGPIITRFIPMQMKRRGVELRLVIEGHDTGGLKSDPALLKAVARAHRWFDDLACGRAASLTEIAARAGVTGRYVSRLLRLAFLAPAIVEAILEGRQPADLTAQMLLKRSALPRDWAAQKRVLDIE